MIRIRQGIDADMAREIGFTGSRLDPDVDVEARIGRELLDAYEPGAKFHHGCCVGRDVAAARLAKRIGYWIVAHPPIDTTMLAPEAEWFADEVREPKTYFARNRDIVDETTELLASPPTRLPQAHGGTWYTIGYARKRGKPVTLVLPGGAA